MDSTMLISFLLLLVLILIAWAIARAIKRTANKYPPVAPDENNISGVGGWLLLLILGLMFLGPLMGAGRINSDFMSVEDQYPNIKTVATWATYKSATWLTFLLVCILSFYAGIGLLKGRNILVVKRAKIILWIIGPIASVVMGLLVPLFVVGKSEPDPQFIGNLIASIVAAAIWTAYLSKSKRVMTTYGTKSQGT